MLKSPLVVRNSKRALCTSCFGLNHNPVPVCLECLLLINEKSVFDCPSCGLPLCSASPCGEKRESGNGKLHKKKIDISK